MSTKKLMEWKDNVREIVSNMSNMKLLEETLFLAGGDDYEGCFTERGQWEYDYMLTELKERLGEDWLSR